MGNIWKWNNELYFENYYNLDDLNAISKWLGDEILQLLELWKDTIYIINDSREKIENLLSQVRISMEEVYINKWSAKGNLLKNAFENAYLNFRLND